VAVSGYNITIIAEYVLLFFINAGLWRKNASRVASVFIIIFVLMIGAPSSAVRAAIMALLTMWAARNSRISDSLRALIFAVTLMVLLSPLALRYDTGLQLSFLAAAGLILFQSKLEALFPWVTARWELRATLASTLSAQFGVLGILIYSFHTLSPISLVVNLMILPLIPLLMLGGFLAVVLGFIWLPMAQWLSIPLYLVLQLQLKSILWSASFPWAQVNIGKIWNWWVVGYYGLAGYWGRMRG
jgi:competence protein ComEC